MGQKLNKEGFLDAARKAGANMKHPLASLLRAFPEHFQLVTSAKGGDSRVRLGAAGRRLTKTQAIVKHNGAA